MPEFKCPQLGSFSVLVGELMRVRASKPSVAKPQVIIQKADRQKPTAQKVIRPEME